MLLRMSIDGESDAVGSPRRTRATIVRWVLGLVIGAVAVWVAFSAAGGLGDSWTAIRALDVAWLVPAFVIEALSYVVLGERYRRLVGPTVVRPVEAIEIGLVVSGFGLLTPARPAEGLALAGAHLHRRGLSRRRVTMVFGLAEWFSTRVFLFLCASNLLVVAVVERDPLADFWPFLVAGLVVLALLAVTARMATRPATAEWVSRVAGSLRRPGHRASVADRRARGAAWYGEARTILGTRRHRAALALLTAVAVLADVACLWFAVLATGAHVGFDVALLAITVAAGAAFIPLVSGGLGIVEAAIPAVFHHFGVPYDDGLAAAIVYRAFGTFVPAGVGAFAIVGLRRYVPSRSTRTDSSVVTD